MPATNKKRKHSTPDGPTRWLPSSHGSDHKKSNDGQPPSWSNIPAVLLRIIYQSLSDVDRASMSRVCKHWREGFHDPSLWRNKAIMFCHRKSEQLLRANSEFTSGRNAIKLVKQFPRYLKELDVMFLSVPDRSPKEIIDDFQRFSKLVDDAKLTKIVVLSLQHDKLKGQIRKHFINALKRLIEKQTFLETFYIVKAHFDLEGGLQFLKRLATSSGATISLLSLEGLCLEDVFIYRDQRFVTEMQKFTNLFYIHIDYVMLSEEMVKSWVKGCPLLSDIRISARRFLPLNHVIRCEAWQDLTTTHPDLTVILEAKEIRSTREMLPILSPAMPVSNLRWEAWQAREDGVTTEFELTRLLRRVASYHRTIKELFLEVPGDFPSLNTISVQNILSNCRHLLPFTCEESFHLPTWIKIWRLSQVT